MRRLAFLAACNLLAACGSELPLDPLDGPAKTVHVRGYAYSFNSPTPVANAQVKVAELSYAATTTAEDGSYDLAIAVTLGGQEVTPYIVAKDFHTVYLQTFALTRLSADLQLVNFQTPTQDIYEQLSTLVGVDPKGNGCHIVTTVSEIAIQKLSFLEFTQHGAHGVAGATAFAKPELPPPLYFSEAVLPDPDLKQTTRDGGVLWLNVPPGRYQIAAKHATQKFDTFTAVCAPGRVINANPPWGLREIK